MYFLRKFWKRFCEKLSSYSFDISDFLLGCNLDYQMVDSQMSSLGMYFVKVITDYFTPRVKDAL